MTARHTVRYIHELDLGVNTLALTPSGTTAAIADGAGAGVVRVVDIDSGEDVDTDLQPLGISQLMFSDDSRLIIAGASSISAVDLESGAVEVILDDPDLTSVVLDSRGSAVLTRPGASRDESSVEVIDLESGEMSTPQTTAELGSYPVTSAAGEALAATPVYREGGPVGEPVDTEFEILDQTTGEIVSTVSLDVPSKPADDLGIGAYPDTTTVAADLAAERLAVVGLEQVQVVSIGSGDLERVDLPQELGRVTRAAFANGTLVLATADGSAFVHDLVTGVTTDIGGIRGFVRSVATAQGTDRALVGGQDGAVQVVDVTGSTLGERVPVTLEDCSGDCVGISNTGSGIALGDEGAAFGDPGEPTWMAVEDSQPSARTHDSVAISADGTTLAVGREGNVDVLGRDGLDETGSYPAGQCRSRCDSGTVGDRPMGLAFSPDGVRLAAGEAVIDLEHRELTDATGDGGSTLGTELAWSPDGALLAASDDHLGRLDFENRTFTSRDPELYGAANSNNLVLRDFGANDEQIASCNVDIEERASEECGPPSNLRIQRVDAPTAAVWSSVDDQGGYPYNALGFDAEGGALLGSDRGAVLRAPITELDNGVRTVGAPTQSLQRGSEDLLAIAPIGDGRVVAVQSPTSVTLYDIVLQNPLGVLVTGTPGEPQSYGFSVSADRSNLIYGRPGSFPVVVTSDATDQVARLCRIAARDLTDPERNARGVDPESPRGCPDNPVLETSILSPTNPTPPSDTSDPGPSDPEPPPGDHGDVPEGTGPTEATDPSDTEPEPEPDPETGFATVDEFLSDSYAVDGVSFLGSCENASPGAVTDIALCSVEYSNDGTETVIGIGPPGSEIYEYLLLRNDGNGWELVDDFSAPDELPYEGPTPDWLP